MATVAQMLLRTVLCFVALHLVLGSQQGSETMESGMPVAVVKQAAVRVSDIRQASAVACVGSVKNVYFRNLAKRNGVTYTVYIYVSHYPVKWALTGASPVVYFAGALAYGTQRLLFSTPANAPNALFWAYAYPSNYKPPYAPWNPKFQNDPDFVWSSNGNYRLISNPFGQASEVARVPFKPFGLKPTTDTVVTLTVT